jgi:hypothetical protein
MTRDLWRDKFYVAQKFKDLLDRGEAKEAYKGSWEDRKRDWLTEEELCEFTWQWRFKEGGLYAIDVNDIWLTRCRPRR